MPLTDVGHVALVGQDQTRALLWAGYEMVERQQLTQRAREHPRLSQNTDKTNLSTQMGKVVTRKAGAGRTRSVKKHRHSSLYVKIRNKNDSIEGAHGGHAGEFGQLGTNRLQRP